jgi:hypothetical protein
MPNPTCLFFSLVHAPVLLLRLGFLEVTHDRKQTRRSRVVARGEAIVQVCIADVSVVRYE